MIWRLGAQYTDYEYPNFDKYLAMMLPELFNTYYTRAGTVNSTRTRQYLKNVVKQLLGRVH